MTGLEAAGGALLLTLLLSIGNARWGSLRVALFNRWLRWLAISAFFGFMLADVAKVDRPLWALLAVGVLSWALLESLYHWLWIAAASRSDPQIFVRYRPNVDGDEWPTDRASLLLRDWLRAQGMRKLCSGKADLGTVGSLRTTVYQSEDNAIRCQVFFFPPGSGRIQTVFQLTSKTPEGDIIVTDNFFLPSALFWPTNWFVERHPLESSLMRLARRHRARLTEFAIDTVPWSVEDPLVELNEQQRTLEGFNLRQGYLQPYEVREEEGTLTSQARYRLWKEVWLLNYFGRPLRSAK